MAYSLDFRKQVLKVKKQENLTFQETSERFGINIRNLFRWSNRIEPILKRNKPASKVDMDKLAKDIKKNPDAYQYERAERLGVTQSAIFYALKRLGYSVKKTLIHPKADQTLRLAFQSKINKFKSQNRTIVYIDESGFAVDAPRTRGYSIKGNRCYGIKDWHCKGRVNAIGALIGLKLLTVCLFDSYINSDVFYSWVKEDLIQKLPKNSVVVMDNATFHKRADTTLLLEDEKHEVFFLPAYSPDLNPIEKKWAQAKAIRRKLRCTPEQLFLDPNL